MSLTAIINLAERLLNNTSDQPVEANFNSRPSKQTARAESDARVGDQFTPSSANQPDAGLFQVNQISFFSAAADFLLAQTLPPQTNPVAAPAATPANVVPTPAVVQPLGALAQNPPQTITANPIVAARFPAVNTAPTSAAPGAAAATATAPAANAAIAPPPATTTPATPANSTQDQLQALNTALYALGLNNTQLAQIDQIASRCRSDLQSRLR